MKDIAEANSDYVCSNPNLSFTKRKLPDGKIAIDIINVCANDKKPEPFDIKYKGNVIIRASLMPGEIKHFVV